MTIEQDFLPYAVGGSANVLSQSAYAALTSLLQNGLTSGIVPSNQLNKTMRQSSVIAAMIAQFIVDNSGQPAIDDGTTATLEANLLTAIRSATKTGVILADTGAANAYTAVNVPPLVAGTWVDGVVQQVKIVHANTGASTYSPDTLTAIPIYGLGLQPLQGGELFVGGTAIMMHATIAGINSGNPIAVLLECAGGAQQIAPATQSQHAVQLGQVTGRLLRVSQYAIVSGSQQVSVNGAAYTTTGATTFNPLSLTTSVIAEVQGGGGGGAGVPLATGGQVSLAPGGGTGAYAKGRYTSGFSGLTVTVGAAGAAGSSGGGTGGTGGTSSLGALISAVGGPGATGGAAGTPPFIQSGSSGAAAPTTGNIVNASGIPGGDAMAFGVSNFVSGIGSPSIFGGGGARVISASQPGGAAPSTSYGAGGAGGGTGGSVQAGGAGAGGCVIVYEYA